MSPTEQQVRAGAKLVGISVFENGDKIWLEAELAEWDSRKGLHGGSPTLMCFSWAHALATLQEPGAIAHLKEPVAYGHLY